MRFLPKNREKNFLTKDDYHSILSCLVKTKFKLLITSWIGMGFQNIPVCDLNGSDPYQTFSSIYDRYQI